MLKEAIAESWDGTSSSEIPTRKESPGVKRRTEREWRENAITKDEIGLGAAGTLIIADRYPSVKLGTAHDHPCIRDTRRMVMSTSRPLEVALLGSASWSTSRP